MQPRSLGKKKSQSKEVGESSSSSLIMKEGWVEGGERAQRRERKEIETLQRADRFSGGTAVQGAKGAASSHRRRVVTDSEGPWKHLLGTPKEERQNALLRVGRIDFPKNSSISYKCSLQSSLICPGGSR